MRKALLTVLAVFTLTAGHASAQQVPTWDGKEWTLPVQEASDEAMRQLNEVAAGPVYETTYTADYSYQSLVDYIYVACAREGCDPGQLVRVMNCESGGNHSAVGPNGERGVMQIHPSGIYSDYYWSDPYTQIDVAADAFGRGVGSIEHGGWVCQ